MRVDGPPAIRAQPLVGPTLVGRPLVRRPLVGRPLVGRRRVRGALAAAVLALGLATACSAPDSPADRYAQDPEALKRGRSLFVGTCGAYCHGLRPGNRDAPYLFDCEWKHGGSAEEIFRTIREGVPRTRMQGFADRLPEGDEDIWKLVAFIRSKAACS